MRLVLQEKPATTDLAQSLASLVKKGDVVTLKGELGVGKTYFCQSFISALEPTNDEITSPTYNIVQEYQTPRFPVYHFDLYRVQNEDELYELAMEDAFEKGVSLIEWAERLGANLPQNRLDLHFHFHDLSSTLREVELIPHGTWVERIKNFDMPGHVVKKTG